MPDNPLVANLVTNVQSLAYGHHVLAVKVRLGAASPISLAELREPRVAPKRRTPGWTSKR